MITVTFADGCLLATASKSLWQYDYGQQLEIVGLDLPEAFQVDFCNSGDTATITVLGENNVVQIPEQFIADGRSITAFCFVYDETTGGTTKAEMKLPVLPRPERTDEQPDPEQEHVIDQLITKLGEDVEDAEAWAVGERDGEPVSEDDPTYHNNAKYWSEKAKSDAPVTSVNGEAGDVELDLDDIPNGETYARATPAQLAQIANNATDIADVKETADTALQPDDLEPYRTAAAQDAIDNGKQSKIIASGILKGDGNGGITAAVAGTDYVAPSALNAYRTASDQTAIDDAQDANITNNADDIDAINAKIPAQASANNKLADKSFVNSSIQTSSAHFRGNWEDWAAVPTNPNLYPVDDDGNRTPTSNDYMVIQDASDYPVQAGETALEGTWRFKYSGVWATNGRNGWHKEYQVNETPLTAAQLAAINSGATAELISQISTNEEDISAINAKIPANASEANKLTDESRVNAIANAKLSFYRTAAAQDSIDAGKQSKINAAGILKGDGSGGVSSAVAGEDYITGLEILSYGNSTWADFLAAYTANKVVYCRASSNSNPASGSQTRMAFMAYVNDAANPTNVEFQYYRSVQTHSDSQQGDQVFVYKLDKTAGWTVTTRNTFTAIDAGTGLSKAYENGKLTLSVDGYRTAADQDTIDSEQDERIDGLEQTTTATTIGPSAIATFDASAANMPLKGLTANIGPVQSGSGDPSPDNVRPITGLTGCKLHHTGVSLIGGDAFIGYTFSKTATGYQLSYNGSSMANRASANADIRGLPAGRYTIAMLNPSYPAGVEVNIRRNTAGSTVTMGVIIGSDTYGRRTYNIPENTTSLQLYILPGTMPLNTSITMSDIVIVREGDEPEPYKGDIYNITFPSEAGTVYGGTLDAVNRKLNSYPYYSSYNGETLVGPWVSSMDVYTPGATPTLGAQVVDMGGAATSYDLPDVPEITTLFGENNIWANRGDVTVTYGAYLETVKAYADKVGDSILSAIAPLETSYTASRSYAAGSFLFVGTKFYKVTAAISSGDTITPDTNVTLTTVAEQLMALANV